MDRLQNLNLIDDVQHMHIPKSLTKNQKRSLCLNKTCKYMWMVFTMREGIPEVRLVHTSPQRKNYIAEQHKRANSDYES